MDIGSIIQGRFEMKDKELRRRFDNLAYELKAGNIIKSTDSFWITEDFNRVMGRHGAGSTSRIEKLENQYRDQNKLIKKLMEHFKLEIHKPDCAEILRERPNPSTRES